MTDLILHTASLRFGGIAALDAVSVVVRRGLVTALVGPNGAGKTTALHVLSGVLRPDSGSVHLDDTDVTRWSPARRARSGIGRTFQQSTLFGSMSVAENIAVALEASSGWRPRRLARTSERLQRAAALVALDRCGAGDLAELRPQQLTTGQRRVAGLARALASEPRYVLLDEPAAGLAAAERTQLGELLRSLAADGLGVLLVEHDLGLVSATSDVVTVMRDGSVIHNGPTADWTTGTTVRTAYLGGPRADR